MKILLLDVETSWAVGAYWGRSNYEQNIIQEIDPWYILSIAYQWFGESTIHIRALPDFPRYKRDRKDDKDLVLAIAKLLDEADYVVAHNGDGFDLKKINTQIVVHGGNPPSPYRTGDTLKIARSRFGFTSNALNDLCARLNIGKKLPHTGKDLWERCMGPYDPKAWALMKRYNKHDVYLLTELYKVLRPWMTNHPNVNLDTGGHKCPICSSQNLHRAKLRMTLGGKRYQYQCKDCGHYSQGKKIIGKSPLEIV